MGGSGVESLFSYSEMALSPNNLGYSVGADLEWDGCERGTCYPLGLGSGSCLEHVAAIFTQPEIKLSPATIAQELYVVFLYVYIIAKGSSNSPVLNALSWQTFCSVKLQRESERIRVAVMRDNLLYENG